MRNAYPYGARRLRFLFCFAHSSRARRDRGGFTAVPAECLCWDRRKYRLVHEILRSAADIVCLEELDHYEDWLNPIMSVLGFDSLFEAKPKSPCLATTHGMLKDGCAVFYRRQLFSLVSATSGPFVDSSGKVANQIAVLVSLRCRRSDRVLTVAVSHLKADKTADGELVRTGQVEQLFARLALQSTSVGSGCVLVCLDMNASPLDKSDYAAAAYSRAFTQSIAMGSAYGPPCAAAEPAFTTWKHRPAKDGAAAQADGLAEAKHTIDYILYSLGALRLCERWAIPAEERIAPTRMPGLQYPSDHFALCATFCFAE